MSARVTELLEAIKEKGRQSTHELPALLEEAERLALDESMAPLSRALALRAVANGRQMMNQFESAVSAYDKSIRLLEGLQEPEELGRTLHAKVGLLNFMCRYDELLVCADRARAIFEALQDPRRLARLDANLSHVYNRLNRFDLVLEFSERALAVLERAGDREGTLVALTNSAVALMLLSDFEEAQHRYQRALKLTEEQGWSMAALSCRFNIAYLDFLRGDSAAALEELSRLRPSYEQAGDRRQLCQCRLNEAEILMEIGGLDNALEAAQEAHALATGLGLSLETGKALVYRASALRGLGHENDAEALLIEASEHFHRERNNVWTAIAGLQLAAAHAAAGSTTALEHALAARDFLQGSGLPNRLALADIVIGRIRRRMGDVDGALASFRSAIELSARGRSGWMQFHAAHELGALLAARDPEVAERHLQAAETQLDSLWAHLGSDDLKMTFLTDRENLYSPLVRLAGKRSAERAFEISERARARVLRERLDVAPPGVEGLAGALSGNEAVVEYFIDGDDILAFSLTCEGVRMVRIEAAREDAEVAVAHFDRHLASCSDGWEKLSAASQHQARTARSHLSRLYEILLSRLESPLPQRLVIVPHGLLHRVPFQVLWDGRNYVIDNHDVVYSPSASLYCSPAPPNSARSSVLIAFTAGARTSAEEEVREAAAAVDQPVLLIDPSIDELRDIFRVPHKLVHIAGHAGIDTVGGTLSWIQTSQGRLTQRDLSALRVRARTVIITGCKTARRTIQPGDEWQGLMRSFYQAGAETIVSAFWDIRDESARRFASRLYNTAPTVGVVRGVSDAMKEVRQWQAHPYFWAGFSTFVRKSWQEDT